MNFSQRVGKIPVKVDFQLGSMDDDLRIRLWNCLTACVFRYTPPYTSSEDADYFVDLWHNFFKWTIDSIPHNSSDAIQRIRDVFFALPWYRIYDFLEHLASMEQRIFLSEKFIEICNTTLKSENSGYRFINGMIAPITSEEEIQTIQTAINNSNKKPEYFVIFLLKQENYQIQSFFPCFFHRFG